MTTPSDADRERAREAVNLIRSGMPLMNAISLAIAAARAEAEQRVTASHHVYGLLRAERDVAANQAERAEQEAARLRVGARKYAISIVRAGGEGFPWTIQCRLCLHVTWGTVDEKPTVDEHKDGCPAALAAQPARKERE